MGGGQVREPAKTEEIVHPRTDFREAMKAAGASDAEIEALMLAHVRIDGWAMLGFSWVMLIGFPLVNRIITDHPGLSDQQQIALGMGGILAPMLVYMLLLSSSAQAWVSPYESRFDAVIMPSIRYRASENTYQEFHNAWFVLVMLEIFALVQSRTQGYPMIFGIAAFNAMVILGTIYWKTGSIRISSPVEWKNEVFYPHQVKATAGSVVGRFQQQVRDAELTDRKKEHALIRADRAAIRARRESRRPK